MIPTSNVQLIFPSASALHVPSAAMPPHVSITKFTDELTENVSPDGIALNLKVFMEYFKGFEIDQIELWISGAMETKGLLKLAIAAKGEGGVKVVLRPPKL